MNAIQFPSGDQRAFEGSFASRVTWDTAPSASIHRTKICDPEGSPSRVNRMRVPSGDHRAPLPSTSSRFRDPSAFMIQSAEARRSLTLSTHPRVYTMREASGAICGSLTDSMSR